MLVGILIGINLLLIYLCIKKNIDISFLEDINDDMVELIQKLKRENENLMAVIENDDKVIKEMKEGK